MVISLSVNRWAVEQCLEDVVPYEGEELDRNLRFLHAYPVHTDANEHYSLHAHTHHELVLVQSGRFRSQVSGIEYIVVPGDILLYTARTPHEEWAEDGAPVVTWACGFVSDGVGPDEPVYRRDIHGKIQDLLAQLAPLHFLDKMRGTWERHNNNCLPILQAVLVELRQLPSNRCNDMVDEVRAFIRSHMAQPLMVANLADHVGLSRGRFTEVYREFTGRTPREDIQALRVEEARRLILTTRLPLFDIAPKVGISNEYHLSRLIKEYLGVGARELRQSKR